MAKKINDWPIKATIIDTEAEAQKYSKRVGSSQSETNTETLAPDFDPDKYLQDELGKYEERRRIMALKREYSVYFDYLNPTPPFPGMKLNTGLMRWEPENLDEFILEHGEAFKRMVAEKKAHQEAISNKKSRSSSRQKRSKAEESKTPESANVPETNSKVSESVFMVHPEYQCTDSTDAQTASSQTTINDESLEETTAPMTKIPDSDMVDAVMSKSPTSTVGESEDKASVEQSKKTRVSAKMVDAEFDELSREYLQVVSLGEKKPVFLPWELRDALDAISRLSGDRKLSASHVAINIIRAFLNEHRKLINRKLAGVKLSI